ncbi:MAG: hypothetical protein K0Q87_3659 [Neobacillus sp.]|nr:hypothetical protein [Neobacillus sp.]
MFSSFKTDWMITGFFLGSNHFKNDTTLLFEVAVHPNV